MGNNWNDGQARQRRSFSRRSFLRGAVGLGGTLAAVAATRLAPPVAAAMSQVSQERDAPILPPGAQNLASYRARCTGCLLCVAACPHRVLAARGSGTGILQPALSFENGACRQGCVACSQVCPTGAIRPIAVRIKNTTQIGRARLLPDLCVVTAKGETCTECAKNCPTGAIMLVDHGGQRVPHVEEDRCTGCGSCVFHCPVRPSAMAVAGNSVHVRV